MRRAWLVLSLIVVGAVSCSNAGLQGAVKGGPRKAVQPPVVGVPIDEDGCHGDSAVGLARCVEAGRIADDLGILAVPRGPGTAGHARVRAICRERFAALGFAVEEQRFEGGVNVIGVKPGVTRHGEKVVVSAHYDAVGDCTAADDNASGVAVLFEAARALAEARFSRSLVVACWDGGENRQAGSSAYAREAGASVRAMVSLESVGYVDRRPDSQRIPEGFERLFPDMALRMLDNDDRGDFATVVSDRRAAAWARRVAEADPTLRVEVLVVSDAAKAQQRTLHRSDHASFWEVEGRAILLTDTGPFRNPRHHCEGGDDTPDHLDFDFAAGMARLAVVAAALELELRSPSDGFVQ